MRAAIGVWVDHMLSTLLNAQPPIPLHAICALAALVVGGMQMSMQKGTALQNIETHKTDEYRSSTDRNPL